MTVLIFANGDMEHTDWARPLLQGASGVIAADGGLRHAQALGLQPEIVIGDFDSLPAEERRRLEADGTRVLQHSAAKDETDLELALLYAVEHFDGPIRVLAGLGGRLDQIFANVLLLMHPALRARSIRFLTEYQQIWLIGAAGGKQTAASIRGAAGDTVSLIPLGGDVHIRRTEGLRWSLADEKLSFGPARGLSNQMMAGEATVHIAAGYLLVVHTRQEWGR